MDFVTTSFVYDKARNLIAKQDANGHLTTYEYDALNRRTFEHQHLDDHARLTVADRENVPHGETQVDPLGHTGTLDWYTTYDPNGNVQLVTDPKGQLVTNSWGILNRLGSQTWSLQPLPRALPAIDQIVYGYDENGNLASAEEHKTTSAGPSVELTSRVFDRLDRLKSETRYDGKAVNYEYDAKGNRTKVTDPGGATTD